MATSFYSGSGLTNAEQDSIESSLAAAEAAKVAAEAAQAAAETAETNSETAKANSESAKVAAQAAQTSAETAETNASASSASASTSATQSAASATSSASSAASASTDAGTATTKASEASTSASNAAASATSAASSSTSASTSAGTATTKASEASTSAANAATSESNASTSETNAAASAASAASSASSASTDAGTATTKAAEASTSASNASTSETNAASSASSASTSASTATTKAAEASTSATNAASSLASFTGQYSSGASDPTTNLDTGDLFFNTTVNQLKVYNGSSWQSGVTEGNATQSSDGTMSASDKTKLDGIETGATADQSDSEIKTAYENNSDTNAFTDALQTKLNGIETAADVTDTTNVVAALTAGDNITIEANGTIAASGGEITVQDEGVDLSTAATTLNFTGNGVAASGTGAAKTINITDTNTTYSDATTSAAGLMSSTDKTKLDGIETAADVTDTTNVVGALTAGTNITIAADGTISASGGSDADTLDGLDSTQFLRSDEADTATGTLTIGGSTAEKIILNGASTPYIRWQEGSTDKAYIQWNSNGYFDFRNQETGTFNFQSTVNGYGAYLFLTRNDTTTVTDNILGSINFGHTDGSYDPPVGQDTTDSAARIVARAAETTGSGDDGSKLQFYTKPINTNKNSPNVEAMRIDPDGHVRALGDMTVSGTLNASISISASDVPSTLNATTFDGDVTVGTTTADHQLKLYKADNNVSDHLQFYLGSTRMGEIGCEDTFWLRINQETNKNIYTPRIIRADGGFQAASTICAHVSDTNTYLQFHAADQFRVVTGGTERLEVNNTNTTIANNLIVSGTVSNNKAKWSNIDGTGTIAIRDDNGISTVADNGTGKYTQNFSFNMANTTYSSVNSGTQNTTSNVARPGTYQSNTTSSSRVRHSVMSSGGAVDVDFSRHYFIGD